MVRHKSQVVSRNKANRKISSARLRASLHGAAVYMHSRKNPHKLKRRLSYVRVVAPPTISLVKGSNHKNLVLFIEDLCRAVAAANKTKTTVMVCFRNTKSIQAAGAIYLLARVDLLVKKFSEVSFVSSKPPKIPNREMIAARAIVHDVLCQIGFYRLLKQKAIKGPSLPHVDCWQVVTASKVDSEALGNVIEKLIPLGVDGSMLYRAGIEAISNAAEHAYSEEIPSKRVFHEKRWWLLTAVLNDELIVYICDLGHGIPVTLPHTQSPNVLRLAMDKVLAKLPQTASKYLTYNSGDTLQIAVSTLIKETRTTLTHRGKGGKDIKSFIDANPKAQVQIHSNKGFWRYSNGLSKKTASEMGMGYNHTQSIGGTIVGWSVPLNAVDPRG